MVIIPIKNILRTTRDGVQVVIAQTGDRAWVPRNDVLFIPGAMIVPGWLGKRLLLGRQSGGSATPQTARREPALAKSRHQN